MKYFLRANIIPCKGYKRSALIDIIESEVFFFDNSQFETLNELYNAGLLSIDKELHSILKSNNFLIASKDNNFPRIDLKEKTFSLFLIDNFLIDRDINSKYDIIARIFN